MDLHSAGVNWHEAQQQKKEPACVWITLERIGEMLYILQNAFSIINISGFHLMATTVARARGERRGASMSVRVGTGGRP